MKRNQGKSSLFGKIWRGGVMLSLFGLGVAMLTGLAGKHVEDSAGQVATSWGSEATVALAEGVVQLSPIALANACGLGASSCFKCHNGKRAPAPNMDATKAPWHVQHEKVNFSCHGCHLGNPRIMKKDVSHAGLVAQPFNDKAGTCSSCHKDDLSKVNGAYHAIPGAK